MAHEPFEEEPKLEKPRGGGRMVMLGVVGACALGAGLGVWARPEAHESALSRLTPPPAAPEEQAARRLQIVLDDEPMPLGIPLEVLPTESKAEAKADGHTARPQPPAEPAAPRRPPEGLMKVDEIVAPEPPPVVKAVASARPEPPLQPKPHMAEKPKVEKAVAREAAPPKKVEKAATHATAAPKKADKLAKPQLARAAPPKRATKLAKAEAPRRKPVQVAKLEKPKADPTAEARAEARLASLMRAVKATEAKLKAEIRTAQRVSPAKVAAANAPAAKPAAPRPIKVAVREKPRKAKPVMVKASAPARVVPPPAPKPHQPKPVHGEGPLRMVKNTCVSSDPGEALVCADPRLSVRERQMQQAYRQAEAAGVPADQLRRQQQRWLAARAAAARQAPWAVDEVYVARIAELNDQSRSSSDGY